MGKRVLEQAIVDLAQATSYVDNPREPFNPALPLSTARDLFFRFAKRAQRKADRKHAARAARRAERAFVRSMKGGGA